MRSNRYIACPKVGPNYQWMVRTREMEKTRSEESPENLQLAARIAIVPHEIRGVPMVEDPS